MNLYVFHGQIGIPTTGPFDIAFTPLHTISPQDFLAFTWNEKCLLPTLSRQIIRIENEITEASKIAKFLQLLPFRPFLPQRCKSFAVFLRPAIPAFCILTGGYDGIQNQNVNFLAEFSKQNTSLTFRIQFLRIQRGPFTRFWWANIILNFQLVPFDAEKWKRLFPSRRYKKFWLLPSWFHLKPNNAIQIFPKKQKHFSFEVSNGNFKHLPNFVVQHDELQVVVQIDLKCKQHGWKTDSGWPGKEVDLLRAFGISYGLHISCKPLFAWQGDKKLDQSDYGCLSQKKQASKYVMLTLSFEKYPNLYPWSYRVSPVSITLIGVAHGKLSTSLKSIIKLNGWKMMNLISSSWNPIPKSKVHGVPKWTTPASCG